VRLFGRKRGETGDFTRIFYTTDLHGSDTCFAKFLNGAEVYSADVLILGGDVAGKMMVPIVRRNGHWEVEVFGQLRTAETEDELAVLERILRTNGFYPHRTTPDEVADLQGDQSRVEDVFLDLMKETMARWMEMADRKLSGSPVRCYVNLGNDDPPELSPIIEQAEHVIYPDEQVLDIDDHHQMASCGYANMTPWRCARDLPEEELATRLESVISKVRDLDRAIVNFHAPPFDSTLDLAPELTKDLKPVTVGGQPNMIPVGSRAVRESIEGHQPLLGLHGHIHEARGAVNIGRTLCINPGSEYSEGVVHGVLINLRRGEILSHQFVSG
jgi:uncharacterized protein